MRRLSASLVSLSIPGWRRDQNIYRAWLEHRRLTLHWGGSLRLLPHSLKDRYMELWRTLPQASLEVIPSVRLGDDTWLQRALIVRADIADRVIDAVQEIPGKLRAFQPEHRSRAWFKNSLFKDAASCAALLPDLNVFNDPEISAIAARLAEVSTVDPAVLRESDHRRQETIDEVEGILLTVEGWTRQ